MHIIFDALHIEGTPIIWDYDEENNKIICAFYSTNAMSSAPSKQQIINHLRELAITGIALFNSHAEIINAQEFFQNYRYSVVDVLLDSPRCSSTNINSLPNQSTSSNHVPSLRLTPSFFSKSEIPKQIHSAKEAQEPPSLPSTYSLSCDSFKNLSTQKITGISIDELIPRVNQSALWSDTLSYEAYFSNTVNHQYYMPKFLKSMSDLKWELTKKQTIDLYPLRQKLIVTIRSFFDNYLAPAFIALRDTPNTQALALNALPNLIAWLRASILIIMQDSPIIFGKVEFETMSTENKADMFKSDHSYKRAVKQSYLARINPRLEQLHFFVLDDLPSNQLTTNPLLVECLDALKEKTAPYISDMKSHIIVMQDLLIKILKNQYKRNLQKQELITTISKHAFINDFVSFYAILNLMLVEITNNKIDDSKLHQVIPIIIKMVIRSNKNRFCQFDDNYKIIDGPIAQLTEDDQDFYLDHSVCLLLQKQILGNTKLCAFIQKNITKPKYINNISDQLGEIFNSTLKNYLDGNPPINDSEQNCSSVSSFTPS